MFTATVFAGEYAQTNRRGRSKSPETIALEEIIAAVYHDGQPRELSGFDDLDKFMARVRVVAGNNDLSASLRISTDGNVVIKSVGTPKGNTAKVQAFAETYPKEAPKEAPKKATGSRRSR